MVVVAIAFFAFTKTRSSSKSAETKSSQTVSSGKRGPNATAVDLPARRVAGTVYLDDAIAKGARVRLATETGVDLATQTDANGHFEFASVTPTQYFVIAEVDRATGATLPLDLRNPRVDPEKLRLVAHACTASIHGVVRDSAGGVIPKAQIVIGNGWMIGPRVEAGDDGSYELCVPVGDSSVIVRADGYADAAADVNVYGRVTRDFALAPEAVIAGRAITTSDGSPVAGAEISLSPENIRMSRSLSNAKAVADNDGRFRFRGVAPGTYSLTATADHLATIQPTQVIAEVTAPAEDVEVALAPAMSISGRTVDKNKKPVANAHVLLMNDDGDGFRGRGSLSMRSHADGTFVFANLPPGEYEVARLGDDIFERTDPRGVEVKLDKQDVSDVMLVVEQQGSISGRVTRTGKPVEGASVQARPAARRESFRSSSARSDADGNFQIDGVAAGEYELYAESKRLGAFTEGPKATVREGEAVKGIEVELDLAGSIAGTVVDQTGAPVAGVHVRFNYDDKDFGEATTADDGSFKAGALSGGGDYKYEVRQSNDSPIAFRPAAGTKFTPVAVKDGNAEITGVVIKIQYERLAISGRVVTPDGAPVPDVAVTAERRGARGWLPPTTTTDEAGNFHIKDLTTGKYSITAQSAKGSRTIEGVAAGTKNVELKLPMLGEISGTLEGFTRTPSVTAYVLSEEMFRMQQYRAVVTGTSFTFKNLPVGKYTMRATSPDGFAQAEANVEAKKTTTVTMQNPGVGKVEGTVIDESRQPIGDLWCRSSEGGNARTDKSGAFRMPRVVAGASEIRCFGEAAEGRAPVSVEIGKTTRVEVIAKMREMPAMGYSGLELEQDVDEIKVKTIAAGSPGERSGVKVGDTIVKVRGREVGAMFGTRNVLRMIEGPVGSTVPLTLERDDKERTVELKLEARPGSTTPAQAPSPSPEARP